MFEIDDDEVYLESLDIWEARLSFLAALVRAAVAQA